jgi:hypothetical protein
MNGHRELTLERVLWMFRKCTEKEAPMEVNVDLKEVNNELQEGWMCDVTYLPTKELWHLVCFVHTPGRRSSFEPFHQARECGCKVAVFAIA